MGKRQLAEAPPSHFELGKITKDQIKMAVGLIKTKNVLKMSSWKNCFARV